MEWKSYYYLFYFFFVKLLKDEPDLIRNIFKRPLNIKNNGI